MLFCKKNKIKIYMFNVFNITFQSINNTAKLSSIYLIFFMFCLKIFFFLLLRTQQ